MKAAGLQLPGELRGSAAGAAVVQTPLRIPTTKTGRIAPRKDSGAAASLVPGAELVLKARC